MTLSNFMDGLAFWAGKYAEPNLTNEQPFTCGYDEAEKTAPYLYLNFGPTSPTERDREKMGSYGFLWNALYKAWAFPLH